MLELIQMKQQLHITRRLAMLAAAVMMIAVGLLTTSGLAAADSQSFTPGTPVPKNAMLVSLAGTNQSVVPATAQTGQDLVGVIDSSDGSLSGQAGQVNVETEGVVDALVSTLNGTITAGTPITVSPLEGVGAKLSASSGWIIGLAQASLSSSTAGATRTTVQASGGGQQTVYVASIPVAIKVSYFSQPKSSSASSNVAAPKVLQDLANTLAGKHVSTLAIYLSFAIFVIGLVATFLIINSTIRSTFTGLSRQPLSKTRIIRAEMDSLLVAAGVLIFSIIAGLLLLRVL
jgi:hypothetical protein